MLSFDEFRVSRHYRPKVLGMEEESQDAGDMRRLHRKDQEEQYARYVAQHSSKEAEPAAEEKRVVDTLRNSVTLQKNGLRNKSRAEYMRAYRRKPKYCPHCKKQL